VAVLVDEVVEEGFAFDPVDLVNPPPLG